MENTIEIGSYTGTGAEQTIKLERVFPRGVLITKTSDGSVVHCNLHSDSDNSHVTFGALAEFTVDADASVNELDVKYVFSAFNI